LHAVGGFHQGLFLKCTVGYQGSCSKCEDERHKLLYVDNTGHLRRGLHGTLSEELCVVQEQIGRHSGSYSSKRDGL